MSKEDVEGLLADAEKVGMVTDAERGAARYAELRGRRGTELELWHKWNDNGRKEEHLEPLLQSVQPMIKREAKRRLVGLGGSIPLGALETSLQLATLKQIQRYDPARLGPSGKPVQLSTHIHNGFQSITDFVAKNRNARSLPRAKLDKAGELLAARDEFTQEHGREPTKAELAAKLPKWKKGAIAETTRARAPEVYTHFGGGLAEDNSADADKYRAAVLLVYGQLNPVEKQFADLHYPQAGETPMNVKQIANKLGIPQHQVYRVRAKVDKRLAPLVRSS